VVAEKFAQAEASMRAIGGLGATFDARFRPAGDEDEVAELPEPFDPVVLELDPWAEHQRITRIAPLLGARMKWQEGAMEEMAASLGGTRFALKEVLRTEEARVSYRERVAVGVQQMQRATYTAPWQRRPATGAAAP